MDRRRFLTYSGIGALVWAGGVTLLGYYLGSVQVVRDNVDTIFAIVEVVLVAVVLLSVTPILLDAWRRRRRRRNAPPAAGRHASGEPAPVVPRSADQRAER